MTLWEYVYVCIYIISYTQVVGFPGGSDGKASTMRETQVQSLGWEDPLEKEMAIHSGTSA